MPNSPSAEVGDVLIAVITKASSSYSDTPSGWDLVHNTTAFRVLKREATGSDTLTVSTLAATYQQGCVFAIQDAEIADVVADRALASAASAVSTVDSPAVTGYAGGLSLRCAAIIQTQTSATLPSGVDSITSLNTSSLGSYSLFYGMDTDLAGSTSIPSREWSDLLTNKDKTGLTVNIGPSGSGASAIPAFIHHRKLLGVQ